MSRFIRWASNALLGNGLGKMTVIPTGLRGIDLFVPLPVGGDILLTGDPRAGARVLGNELVYRMANLPEQPTVPLVFFDPNLPQFDAARQELIEGVPKLGQFTPSHAFMPMMWLAVWKVHATIFSRSRQINISSTLFGRQLPSFARLTKGMAA